MLVAQCRLKRRKRWVVKADSLQRKDVQKQVARLASVRDADRLRLAARAAGAVLFDWVVPEDAISWEGAIDIFPFHRDPEQLKRASTFINWLNPESRSLLAALIDSRSPRESNFELNLEAGSAFGAVWLAFLGTRIPRKDGSTERVTGVVRPITERWRETQRLTYLATRDELTGHLNRSSLLAELSLAIEQAKVKQGSCAFVVASIDRLAMINDGYGFDVGDEVIVAVGERLSRALRGSDIIGRIAGNKFGAVLSNCSEVEIDTVAERIRDAVRTDVIDTRAGQVAATCSVGAVWLPEHASSSQEAMLRAEQALDRGRATGRNGFAVYQKSHHRERARLKLMGTADEVISALKDDRIVLAYQPIVTSGSHETSHYECLVRMIGRDGSVVSAGQFIPAAEQLGLVRLVDRRALELAIGELNAHPGIVLGVNVSGTTAADPAWLTAFIDYVRANESIAGRLIVELTETAALHHFEENARFVSQLRELGSRIAIDDFGAGYTSFRNLQMLHVDMVKIDGTYVDGLSSSPENHVFVRTLVTLAANFNLETVAEWVNCEADAKLLRGFGVDYYQGFYFGEPRLDPPWRANGG